MASSTATRARSTSEPGSGPGPEQPYSPAVSTELFNRVLGAGRSHGRRPQIFELETESKRWYFELFAPGEVVVSVEEDASLDEFGSYPLREFCISMSARSLEGWFFGGERGICMKLVEGEDLVALRQWLAESIDLFLALDGRRLRRDRAWLTEFVERVGRENARMGVLASEIAAAEAQLNALRREAEQRRRELQPV